MILILIHLLEVSDPQINLLQVSSYSNPGQKNTIIVTQYQKIKRIIEWESVLVLYTFV